MDVLRDHVACQRLIDNQSGTIGAEQTADVVRIVIDLPLVRRQPWEVQSGLDAEAMRA